ncbi:sensor histidine kinase [Lachnospira multipara]|uniref:sensor histidine kinase n=1 Tax=Lachnospira multipara TaxID=28051 RepID=UPI000426DA68|nr:HAMP domain-containing sensor histidine kinase [Lachnospira multipara]
MREIIKKYIKAIVIVVSVLMLINMISLKLVLDFLTQTQNITVDKFINGIEIKDNVCTVNEYVDEYCDKNFKWYMVLNESGEILYSNDLPDELNKTYTVSDIASASKWYLSGYSVDIIQIPNGLAILGNDGEFYWKKNLKISKNTMLTCIIIAIINNIITTVLFSLLFAKKIIIKIKKITDGIMSLSNGEQVILEESGDLKDISKALNIVSKKLDMQKKKIQENEKIKKDWMSGITHDVRTPLAVIIGKCEELKELDSNKIVNMKIKTIQNQSFKIKYLIDDLSLLNNLDINNIIIKKERTKLDQIIRECVADIMNMYDDSDYTIQLEANDKSDELYMEADEHLLKRAFTNILLNSLVHNEYKCFINIVIEKQEEGISIIFVDDGIGVDNKELVVLNNREGNNSSLHGWGTIVVKKIIELHNGKVEFENAKKGMKVCILLPLR